MAENTNQQQGAMSSGAPNQTNGTNEGKASKMKRFLLGPYATGEKKMSKKKKIVIIVLCVLMVALLGLQIYFRCRANETQREIDELNAQLAQRQAAREKILQYDRSDSFTSSHPELWE